MCSLGRHKASRTRPLAQQTPGGGTRTSARHRAGRLGPAGAHRRGPGSLRSDAWSLETRPNASVAQIRIATIDPLGPHRRPAPAAQRQQSCGSFPPVRLADIAMDDVRRGARLPIEKGFGSTNGPTLSSAPTGVLLFVNRTLGRSAAPSLLVTNRRSAPSQSSVERPSRSHTDRL